MQLKRDIIDCQQPINRSFITRKYQIVRCSIARNSDEFESLFRKAEVLSNRVNRAAANESNWNRSMKRLFLDNIGGLLAEAGWIQYINECFGVIAKSKPYTTADNQIDIILENGEIAEVRSSFPYKGVKFAICSSRSNFKNIGPYSNSVKLSEIQKNLYLGVLFDSQKENLLTDETVTFSLVGGSTWQMMAKNGENENLTPKGYSVLNPSKYKVIPFHSALDVSGVIDSIERLGYKRICDKSINETLV